MRLANTFCNLTRLVSNARSTIIRVVVIDQTVVLIGTVGTVDDAIAALIAGDATTVPALVLEAQTLRDRLIELGMKICSGSYDRWKMMLLLLLMLMLWCVDVSVEDRSQVHREIQRETDREREGERRGADNTSEGEADRDDTVQGSTLYRAWKKEEKVQLALWKNHKKKKNYIDWVFGKWEGVAG